MANGLQLALNRAGSIPGVLEWRKRSFDKTFESGLAVGSCRGVFESYQQAAASVPENRALGFDNEAAAGMYRGRLRTIFPSDYPMMLWLQKAFEEGARNVFDLGGHIGISYYAYQRMVTFPSGVSWAVHDVPAVMTAGRHEALTLDAARRLSFADSFDVAADADVLFTAGCVQFLADTLAQRIASLRRRPRWLLVNLLPLHERLAYWTVQSMGAAFCPYRIQHSQTFFSELEKLGYRLEDKWVNLEKRCVIAFEPEHSLDRYYGAALKLA